MPRRVRTTCRPSNHRKTTVNRSIRTRCERRATCIKTSVSAMKFSPVLVQALSINIHSIAPKEVRTQDSLAAAFVITAFFSLSHTPVISSDGRLENLNIQSDNDPLRVVKPADQNVHYKQQVNVRFLEPPPGPEPAPIIIKVRLATRDLYAGLHSLPTGTTSPSSTSTATLGYSSTATNTTDTSSSHHP